MRQLYLTCFTIFFFGYIAIAQVTVDAELRPRFEYRHGYKTLFPDDVDPAIFVSQRTRLNGFYNDESLTFYLSLQDVRVWGDVPQLNLTDKNRIRSEEHTSELQSRGHLVCRLLREKKKIIYTS